MNQKYSLFPCCFWEDIRPPSGICILPPDMIKWSKKL